MSEILTWANTESGAISDTEFRQAAEDVLCGADGRSVRWHADQITERSRNDHEDWPSVQHYAATRQAVELRLLAALEDLRDELGPLQLARPRGRAV